MIVRTRAARCSALVGAAVLASAALLAQQVSKPLSYPRTKTVDHVDTYHGTKVAGSVPLARRRHLAGDGGVGRGAEHGHVPVSRARSRIARQLTARVIELNDYERYSAPSRKGPYFFFSKNEGLQNQSVLFIQKGLDGAPEVLLDPNAWSADGTVRARRVRAVEGRDVRGLRHLTQRVRLAAVQGHGARDEADARRTRSTG